MKWGAHKHFNLDTAKIRFLAKVEFNSANDCWIWKGAIGSHRRYGIVGIANRNWLAHRAAWFLFKNEDPKGFRVCHKCDNGFCVNPKHLFLGTQTDNIHDMENKKRGKHPAGEEHGRAKLTWDNVNVIRESHERGRSIRSLAREFNVSPNSIRRIIKNKGWLTRLSP